MQSSNIDGKHLYICNPKTLTENISIHAILKHCIESNLACLRSLLERVHHVAAVFQQFLLAGVDVLVGGTCRVDRRLAIFQPVSNFASLK